MEATGKISPATVLSEENGLEGSGFTTAGTRGPTECSSIVRFNVEMILLLRLARESDFASCGGDFFLILILLVGRREGALGWRVGPTIVLCEGERLPRDSYAFSLMLQTTSHNASLLRILFFLANYY